MANWKDMITERMLENGDRWENVEDTTLDAQELAKEFDDGYGGTEGAEFTLWTKH